jgi:hypothetical protein
MMDNKTTEENAVQLTLTAGAPAADSSVSEEIQKTTLLLEGREDSPSNFYANLMHALGEHDGPRHRHDFDQVRFPIEGEFVYGEDQVLPEGHVGYFPEGTSYGPQLRSPGLMLFYAQFGGASGRGHLSRRQRRAAREMLGARGTLSKGMFTYLDEHGVSHTMDAHEAMADAIRGQRPPYPAPRYKDVIVMNPANFDWIAAPVMPGVAFKWLGTFNERGTRIGFIRIEAGSTFNAGQHGAPELLFLTKGAVLYRERLCPLHSAMAFEPFEGPVAISAVEPAEFLCIQLPTFSS